MTAREKAAFKFDLAFVLRDCHGNIEAAQRRIDRALAEARKAALEEAAAVCEKRKQLYVPENNVAAGATLHFAAEAIRALASEEKS